MRAQRGQTSAELMGILLLVAAIIAAIVASDAPAMVSSRTKQLICRLSGGKDCGAAPGTAPVSDDGPHDGPALGDGGPFPILPFPGFASVTCAGDTRAAGNMSCVPKGQTGVGVNASDEKKIERTPTTLDANGCPWQNLSVATTLKLGVTGEVKNPTAGGSLSGYLGHQSKYQLTVPPSAADDIAAGRRRPPNPVDPRSIRDGEAIQMTEEWYAGANAKAAYRALQVEMGYDKGRRVSSGVKKIDLKTVRIYVGDEDFVRQALKVGVDLKGVNVSLGNSKDLSDGKLRSIDIDISSEAGWNAYQNFLGSGHLPAGNATGTTNPTHAETVKYSDATTIQAKLGGFQIGGTVNSSDGRVTTTHNPDGTIDNVATARIGDTEIAVSDHRDANGTVIGEPTRSLILHDVDPSLTGMMYARTGRKPPADLGRDVRLDFTESQLRELQDVALNQLADRIAQNGKRPSIDAIRQSLQASGGYEVDVDGAKYGFTGLEPMLGAAKTPNDMLIALYHGGFTSAAVLNNLDALLVGQRRDLPGTIVSPKC